MTEKETGRWLPGCRDGGWGQAGEEVCVTVKGRQLGDLCGDGEVPRRGGGYTCLKTTHIYCTDFSFLVLIVFYCFVRCNQWENWMKITWNLFALFLQLSGNL